MLGWALWIAGAVYWLPSTTSVRSLSASTVPFQIALGMVPPFTYATLAHRPCSCDPAATGNSGRLLLTPNSFARPARQRGNARASWPLHHTGGCDVGIASRLHQG